MAIPNGARTAVNGTSVLEEQRHSAERPQWAQDGHATSR
jgi:hypothetical protein